MSKEGLKKLKEELEYLKTVKRHEISKKIATAREFGDLRENAEYHAAKEEMALLENKIMSLQEKLSRARIIDASELAADEVTIFTRVTLLDLDSDTEFVYELVPQEEADIDNNKIPVTAPVARGLLGKKENDEVEIEVPRGTMRFKILKLEKMI
jgi:transcription elongation factor GreA